MRVAIEAASLAMTSGGLKRYTSELSLALARCFPDDEYFLISDQTFSMPKGAPPNLRRGGAPRNAIERRWWLWGITRELARLGTDLVHGPDFSVPYLAQRPSVLTLHDLSPWMEERWHHDADRVKRRTPLLLAFGLATMVVTPGEMVRKQVLEQFRLRADRVVAVPEAAAAWFRPIVPAFAPSAAPYFLFVGTFEPRKNLPELVAAWRELRRDLTVDLVMVGRNRADAPAILEEPGLHILGELPDEALPELYSGALALVYPSFYEGFGLPVLEAMQCGAPVIVSRAVSEVAGDAAVYVAGVAEIAGAMRHAAECPEFVADRRARSLARAAEFSWERTARLTHEVYEEACSRFAY